VKHPCWDATPESLVRKQTQTASHRPLFVIKRLLAVECRAPRLQRARNARAECARTSFGAQGFLFAGDKEAGQTLAALCPVAATCIAYKLDPLARLAGVSN
jgi:hypothetical protein